jgi:hypothetical protein
VKKSVNTTLWTLVGHVLNSSTSGSSVKANLLRKRVRATLTVQQEAPTYRYVTVEGPVTLARHDPDTKEIDTKELATRSLGAEMGAWYAKHNPPSKDSVVVRLAPEQWLTVDSSKVMYVRPCP